MSCALGTAQLSRLDEILTKRKRAAAFYTNLLSQFVPEVITPPPANPGSTISWFVYVVRLQDDFSRSQRDRIIQSLSAAGIGCNNYFSPIHLQPFYRQRFGFAPGDFPITERVSERTIALPFFTEISEEQMSAVVKRLALAFREERRTQISMTPITETVCCETSTRP
jgi:perosamine synthetase